MLVTKRIEKEQVIKELQKEVKELKKLGYTEKEIFHGKILLELNNRELKHFYELFISKPMKFLTYNHKVKKIGNRIIIPKESEWIEEV